jgi:hypothetical protein
MTFPGAQVELHMRYIQLQRVLQSKMAELEKLCIRERQLLEGKWKTHSLPARKKASQSGSGDPPTPTQAAYSYCRPTVSTEDVAKTQQKQQNPPLIFAYQYLDPHYRYMLQPSASSSGEYLLTFEPSRYRGDQHHFIVKTPCDAPQKQNRGNQTGGNGVEKPKKVSGFVVVIEFRNRKRAVWSVTFRLRKLCDEAQASLCKLHRVMCPVGGV